MKVVMAVLLVPILAFADKRLADNKDATWDCKADPNVSVLGNDSTIRITGACNAIEINGNHNTVSSKKEAYVQNIGKRNTVSQ
jgi:Protein of unknown function (DUF3060)